VVRFFPSGDSEAMAEAMLEVIQNPTLQGLLVQAGLEYVEQNSWGRKRQE
jgi:glycosyltransferase involved in cell wall biosynthesis